MGVKIGSRRGSIMARSFSAGICQSPFRKLNYYYKFMVNRGVKLADMLNIFNATTGWEFDIKRKKLDKLSGYAVTLASLTSPRLFVPYGHG